MTFTGDVTLNNGAVWNETTTGAAATFSFGGNFANNAATFTAQNTAHTFTGAGMTLSGTTATVIPSVTISGTYTISGTLTAPSVTLNGNCTLSGTLTVSTTLAGSSTLTMGATGVLNVGAASITPTLVATAVGNTVNYTGTGQTLKLVAYHHLILSGGAETFGGITAINGDLTLSGSATATMGAGLSIGGSLNIGNGTTFTSGAYGLSVGGTTTVGGGASGTLNISGATGAKTFTGAVTINAGGALTESAAAALSFGGDVTIGGTLTENGAAVVAIAGNLQNNGTYTASTGAHTFSGPAKTIGGNNAMSIPSVTLSGTYTLSQTLTVSTTLAGAGTLTMGGTGVLNIGAVSVTPTLDATAVGNTVNYNLGGIQTAKPTTYYNLTLSTSGAKTITGVSINGTLDFEGTATATFTGTDSANSLTFVNVTQAAGQWGSTTSGALIQDAHFASSGLLNVATGIGPLHHFVISQISSPQMAGQAFTIPTITAQDAGSNTVTSFNSTVTLGGTAGVTGTSAAFTSGVLSGASVTPTVAGTSLTVTATSGSATGSAAIATVNPGALAKFTVTTPATQTAGTAFAITTITAQDANGNTLSTGPNTFTGTVDLTETGGGAGGTVTPSQSSAFVAGVRSGQSVTLSKSGTLVAITVTDHAGSGATGASGTFSVNPGTATHLVYTALPSTPTAGTAFSVTVQSQDANGNPANPTSSTTITLSKASGAGALSGTLTGTIGTSANSVTITTPVYSKADTMTLTATATAGMTSLSPVTSTGITFSPGAVTAAQSTVAASPASVTADGTTTSTITVTLKDGNSNPVPNKNVSLAKTSGPGTPTISAASGPSDASGVVTFTVKSTTAGGDIFTATDTSDSLTITQTASVTFTPGAATQLAFGQQPSNAAESTSITPAVTVQVLDQFGNIVTNSSASVTLAIANNPGSGTLSGGSSTASSGLATFSALSINNSGVGYTLTASSSGLASVTTSAFNVTGARFSAVTTGTWNSTATW
jgi:hypothetical protein